jgi:hypothetical protein
MASQAEGADVLKIAFASSFDDRHDVVRIPQRFARSRAQAPEGEKGCPIGAAGESKITRRCNRIDSADRAYATVTFEYSLAEIGRLRAKLPLVHAERRAKRVSPPRDFKGTPSADSTAIRTARMQFAIDPAALHGPCSAHKLVFKLHNHLPGSLSSCRNIDRHGS